MIKNFPMILKFQIYLRDLLDSIYHEISWNVDGAEEQEILYVEELSLWLLYVVKLVNFKVIAYLF